MRSPALAAMLSSVALLAACEPGPNGLGVAPPGISQEAYEAQIRADREKRSEFYRGPRGGTVSR